MEEDAGDDDGDDVPGEPQARRHLAAEQQRHGGRAVRLQDERRRGGEGGRQARQARDQRAGAARGQQAQHEEEGQEREQRRHGGGSIACPAGPHASVSAERWPSGRGKNAALRPRALSLKPAATAPIAQLVEHVIRNDGVGGSIPSRGTIFHPA